MTECSSRTPRRLRYRMPAEWAEQAALWLAWPYDETTFPGCLKEVEETYLRIMKALYRVEEIRLLVRDGETEGKVKKSLQQAGIPPDAIRLIRADYGDVWFRDYGPTFVRREDAPEIAMVDWDFNSWGGKYPSLLKDTKIPAFMERLCSMPRFVPGLVLEGGSIDVNGEELLLTTEQCLLNPNRNPGQSKEAIEQKLKDFLGVQKVIWLKGGIAGDDTDGHVDDVARFVAPDTVVAVVEEDEDDENHDVLQQNRQRLAEASTSVEKPLRIVSLPTPGRVEREGERLPASYANFLIANGTVLVPTFDHPNDAAALRILGDLFPRRRIVGIDCRSLIAGYGALHCISLQEPARRSEGEALQSILSGKV